MNCTLDELRRRIETHRPHQLDTDQRFLQAAVLVPITRSDDSELVLTLHAAGLSIHGDEVAFPGGRRGPKDADLVHIVLRETEEEVTSPPGLVKVIGPLSALVPRRGTEVAPYIAFVPGFVEYQPSDGEVATVFNTPLSFFRDDPHEATHRIDYFGRSWYVPSYHLGEFKIWGLTAIMVVELVNLLYNDPTDLHTPPASSIKLS